MTQLWWFGISKRTSAHLNLLVIQDLFMLLTLIQQVIWLLVVPQIKLFDCGQTALKDNQRFWNRILVLFVIFHSHVMGNCLSHVETIKLWSYGILQRKSLLLQFKLIKTGLEHAHFHLIQEQWFQEVMIQQSNSGMLKLDQN